MRPGTQGSNLIRASHHGELQATPPKRKRLVPQPNLNLISIKMFELIKDF